MNDRTLILAGDIGGTNTRLALFSSDLKLLYERANEKNANRPSFTEIVKEFLASTELDDNAIDRACFGVAGPVANGHVKPTNLPWELDEPDLARDLDLPKVALVNDLVAHAEGIEVLQPEHFVTIAEGEADPHGNRAVIAAGTGLGEAGLIYDVDINGYRAFASEGGHADFAPRTDQEFALAKFIQQTRGTATWERVLSGPGLRRIYNFLRGSKDETITPEAIAKAAATKSDPLALAALDMLLHFYAAEAGNLALKLLATGGVYLSGAIAVSLIPKMQSESFIQTFRDKGPDKLRPLMEKIPVHVVTLETCALYGAANYARRM